MTSPGSEHISKYRAIGEFDNLVRAARDARRALKDLRDEEAKLNAASIADDKKVIASKQARTKAETDSSNAAQKAINDLNKANSANKAGQTTGQSYGTGLTQGIKNSTKSSQNQSAVDALAQALHQRFGNAGTQSGTYFGKNFTGSASSSLSTSNNSSSFNKLINNIQQAFTKAGNTSGNNFVSALDSRVSSLNSKLRTLKLDELNVDVDVDDALQEISSLEIQLKRLAHEDNDIEVRVITNKALSDIRSLKNSLKDELGQEVVKDAQRLKQELERIDSLPSGKAFKFWALTALSDMSRVFKEAEEGASTFEKLRRAAGAGGGGNFLNSFISVFDDFSESSSNLLQKLGRVSGELYRMPGLIAVLVSAIPALISGLGALGGGALSVASGIGAAGGALAALPGLGIAAISSVGALSSTFGGLKDVLKEAKKAQTDEAYAKEEARLGTNKALTSLQKYKVMINELLPATQDSTLAIVDFADAWTNTKERVGENFFKEIVGSTERLDDLLPIAENLLGRAATALGKVADQGLRMITSGPWKADFRKLAEANVSVIENLGGAGLSLATVFKNIAVAAFPFTTWITEAFRDGAQAFEDWSDTARNGAIPEFLEETKESLQMLWQIFNN